MVTAPARVDPLSLPRLDGDVQRLEPERYKVQFTATEEYVRLVEEAKALLSHAVPNVPLEEIQLRAMRALVAELKKKKYATLDSSPARARDAEIAELRPQGASGTQRDARTRTSEMPSSCARTRSSNMPEPTDALDRGAEQLHTRRRGRHIPAAVRRTVFERDGNRCTYMDANGTRCPETHRLEFHHLKPFAAGSEHCASNLTLRCAAHNALAAERDFGRELIEDRKTSLEHEPAGSFSGTRGD